jgi:hypothetical protein
MSELYQSKTDVYVVIRLRDPETCRDLQDVLLKAGTLA